MAISEVIGWRVCLKYRGESQAHLLVEVYLPEEVENVASSTPTARTVSEALESAVCYADEKFGTGHFVAGAVYLIREGE